MRKLFKKLTILLVVSILTIPLSAQVGLASYYSDDFHGRRTASGEKYDKNALTAAHTEFPFGSYIRVTRLDNNHSVVVKVNDRGPYFKGYVVDLSRRSAEKLGIIEKGIAKVKVELEKNPRPQTEPKKEVAIRDIESGLPVEYNIPDEIKKKVASNEVNPMQKKLYADKQEEFTSKGAKKKKEVNPPKKVVKIAKPTISPKPKSIAKIVNIETGLEEEAQEEVVEYLTDKKFNKYDLYKIELKRPKKKGYGVQIGTFVNYDNVLKQVAILQGKSFDNILISIEKKENGTSLYKVILGPFLEREKATGYKKSAAKRYKIKGFVVDLSTFKY